MDGGVRHSLSTQNAPEPRATGIPKRVDTATNVQLLPQQMSVPSNYPFPQKRTGIKEGSGIDERTKVLVQSTSPDHHVVEDTSTRVHRSPRSTANRKKGQLAPSTQRPITTVSENTGVGQASRSCGGELQRRSHLTDTTLTATENDDEPFHPAKKGKKRVKRTHTEIDTPPKQTGFDENACKL